ncbi:tyrosine-type recombinase/integrase [Planctomycetota bacterium]|nr:tyrosine-type recombinase/integrase [Planctomycetota bacterium]
MSLQSAPSDPPELLVFEEDQRLRNMAPKTIRARVRVIRLLSAWLGRSLVSASVADLRAFVAARRQLGLAEASQVSEIGSLKVFYAVLVERELIASSPADALHTWRVRSTRRPLSLKRVRELLEAADQLDGPATPNRLALAQRDRACLELLFATGMRASEVVAAQVVDFDLTDGSVLVRRAKRGSSRRIPLPAAAAAAIRRYVENGRGQLLRGRDDPGALLIARTGVALEQRGLQDLVRRVSRRVGSPTHSHAFRRTLASELVRAGTCLPAVQKILGHAHLTTTTLYVEVRIDEMREALESLEQLQAPSRSQVPALDTPPSLQRQLFNDWQVQAA